MDFTFETPTIDINANRARGQIVIFENRQVRNNFKSNEAGRPIYDNIEFIKIINPGSRDTYENKVTDEFKEKFATQYEAWKSKGQQVIAGTPLKVWPEIEPILIASFRELNIHTVEHLAELSDSMLVKCPPGTLEWRKRAKAFLEYSKNAGQFVQVRTQLEESKEENTKLNERLKALEALVAELTDKKTKKAA